MIKECCIRTASLVTLIPSMNNDEDCKVCWEKHLQRFLLNKVVFIHYSCQPCQNNGFYSYKLQSSKLSKKTKASALSFILLRMQLRE